MLGLGTTGHTMGSPPAAKSCPSYSPYFREIERGTGTSGLHVTKGASLLGKQLGSGAQLAWSTPDARSCIPR